MTGLIYNWEDKSVPSRNKKIMMEEVENDIANYADVEE